MKNVLVMGPPGSGKGTQATLLKDKLKVAHISTGDLFRNEIASNTDLGKEAQTYISAGKYVPDELTIRMLQKRMKEPDCKNGFILDGFPRTFPQAEFLKKMLEEKKEKINYVFYYKVADKTVVERIKGRAQKDKAAGKTVRADDLDPKTIQARLDTYHTQTSPILEYYKKAGVLHEINAEKTVEEIFAESVKILDKKTK